MSKVKLNQIIAVEKGAKTRTHEGLTGLHRLSMKGELFNGLVRSYRPKTEEGDKLPDENKLVQQNVLDVIDGAIALWADFDDVLLTKEVGNTVAKANVTVDGKVLISDAPVSFLIQLEKQLDDVYKFVETLPTLSPDEQWSWNEGQRMHQSDTVETARTTKVTEFVVVPGSGVPEKGVKPDVKEVTKDIVAGYWKTQKLSATLAPSRRRQILERVDKLRNAVKMAREEANSIEVDQKKIGKGIFDFIFA